MPSADSLAAITARHQVILRAGGGDIVFASRPDRDVHLLLEEVKRLRAEAQNLRNALRSALTLPTPDPRSPRAYAAWTKEFDRLMALTSLPSDLDDLSPKESRHAP